MNTRQTVFVSIVVLICIFSLAISHPAQSEENSSINTLKHVKHTKTMKVGYIPWAPTVIKDSKGKLSGHFVDTIEYIANEIGVKVSYYETDWATFENDLQAGKCDVVIAGTFKTIKRAYNVAYTRPLFYLGISALVRKDETRFTKVADFNHKDVKISITKGTGEHDFCKTHFPTAKLMVSPGTELFVPISKVISGETDAAFADTFTIEQFLKEKKEGKGLFVSLPLNLTPVAWTLRHSDIEWTNFLNNALEFLETSGKLRSFEEKYNAHWLHRETKWKSH
ncbi:substrate-binding periplasmic protein [Candidatus Uabimicrobium sp. HlEnr_7]|uniref:substrate-binding periplasmic protein n=1 Tax=Candidatus Uabimicrobium helgolandensis TaxID=3095367 RepID=UPI0035591537